MTQKKWTESERLELSKKLDDDLDKFIDNLAQKSSVSKRDKPFDFDEWSKEFDQHPVFMKDLHVNENGKFSDAVQALQALKYDNNEGNSSIEEQIQDAECAKKEGNKHFKFEKYRWAIDSYTNGIRVCCPDRKLNAILYANRSAAHKRIGNIRSSLKDCVIARKFDPSYEKAIIRAAECLLELGYCQQCIDWIDSSLSQLQADNVTVISSTPATLRTFDELRARARRMLVKVKRDARKRRSADALEIGKIKTLLGVFRLRGICFLSPQLPTLDEENNDEEALCEWFKNLEVVIPQYDRIPIVYYEDTVDQLVWPLLIQYPEFGQTDLVNDCMESTLFKDLLSNVLVQPAEWDKRHDIRADNIRLFVPLEETLPNEHILEVFFNQNLRDVMATQGVALVSGLPVLQIYSKSYINNKINVVEGKRMKFRKMT